MTDDWIKNRKKKPYKVKVEGDTMWEAFMKFIKDLLTSTNEPLSTEELITKSLKEDQPKVQLDLKLKRKWFTENSTIGELYVDGSKTKECYTLEDFDRKGREKVHGATAIPRGVYDVVITQSPRFKTRLPLLKSVPGFEGVRIHPGNTHKDTEGCILLGQTRSEDFIGRSRLAFNALFKKLDQAQKDGKKIIIEVD